MSQTGFREQRRRNKIREQRLDAATDKAVELANRHDVDVYHVEPSGEKLTADDIRSYLAPDNEPTVNGLVAQAGDLLDGNLNAVREATGSCDDVEVLEAALEQAERKGAKEALENRIEELSAE